MPIFRIMPAAFCTTLRSASQPARNTNSTTAICASAVDTALTVITELSVTRIAQAEQIFESVRRDRTEDRTAEQNADENLDDGERKNPLQTGNSATA